MPKRRAGGYDSARTQSERRPGAIRHNPKGLVMSAEENEKWVQVIHYCCKNPIHRLLTRLWLFASAITTKCDSKHHPLKSLHRGETIIVIGTTPWDSFENGFFEEIQIGQPPFQSLEHLHTFVHYAQAEGVDTPAELMQFLGQTWTEKP